MLSYSNVRRSKKSVRTRPEEETSLIVPLCGDNVAVTSEIRNYDYNGGMTFKIGKIQDSSGRTAGF